MPRNNCEYRSRGAALSIAAVADLASPLKIMVGAVGMNLRPLRVKRDTSGKLAGQNFSAAHAG